MIPHKAVFPDLHFGSVLVGQIAFFSELGAIELDGELCWVCGQNSGPTSW
jgi:hypothetical protein